MEQQRAKLDRLLPFVLAVPASIGVFYAAAYLARLALSCVLSNTSSSHDPIPGYALICSLVTTVLLMTTAVRRRSKRPDSRLPRQ